MLELFWPHCWTDERLSYDQRMHPIQKSSPPHFVIYLCIMALPC